MLQALRDNVSIDRSVLFEQPQPPLRIAAIRAPPFFSLTPSDKHAACVVITVCLTSTLDESGVP
jgi:hypothetical protein